MSLGVSAPACCDCFVGGDDLPNDPADFDGCAPCCVIAEKYGTVGCPGSTINSQDINCDLATQYEIPGCNGYLRPNNRPPVDPTSRSFVPNNDGNNSSDGFPGGYEYDGAGYPPNDTSGVPGGGDRGECDGSINQPHYCAGASYNIIQVERLTASEYVSGMTDCLEGGDIKKCYPSGFGSFFDDTANGNPGLGNPCIPGSGCAIFYLNAWHSRQCATEEECPPARDAIFSIKCTTGDCQLKTFFPGIAYDPRPDQINIYPGSAVEVDGNALLQNPFWRQLGNWTGSGQDWFELLESFGIDGDAISQPSENLVGYDFPQTDLFVRCRSDIANAPYSPDGSDIIGIDYALYTPNSNEFASNWGTDGQPTIDGGFVPITLREIGGGFKNEPVGTVGSGKWCEDPLDPACGFTHRWNSRFGSISGGNFDPFNSTKVDMGTSFRYCESENFLAPCYSSDDEEITPCATQGLETGVCGVACEEGGYYYLLEDPRDGQDSGPGCYIPYDDGSGNVLWKKYAIGEIMPGCCGIKNEIDAEPPEEEDCGKIETGSCPYTSADCGTCNDVDYCDIDSQLCETYNYTTITPGMGFDPVREQCIHNVPSSCELSTGSTKYCSPLINSNQPTQDPCACFGYDDFGGEIPVESDEYLVFSTGTNNDGLFGGIDNPGVYVGPIWKGNQSWLDPMYIATHGLFYARGSVSENDAGELNSAIESSIYGKKGVLTKGKTSLREGGDISNKTNPCTTPDCLYAFKDDCDGVQGMNDHDNYATIIASSPQRIGFEVTDEAMCSCLYDAIKDTPMEWNMDSDYYVDDNGQRKPVIQRGYRYVPNKNELQDPNGSVYKKYTPSDNRKIESDNIGLPGENHYWTETEKWPIEMSSGSLEGEPCNSSFDCGGKCGRITTDPTPGDGTDYWNPLSFVNAPVTSTNNTTFYVAGDDDAGSIFRKFYQGSAANRENFCRGYWATALGPMDMNNNDPIFEYSFNGGIVFSEGSPGHFNSEMQYTPFVCGGNMFNVGFTIGEDQSDRNYSGSFAWWNQSLVLEGECDTTTGACNQVIDGEFWEIECTQWKLSTAQTPFSGLPDLECASCNPFAPPMRSGYQVPGFSQVRPRSTAYSNYVSNTYFRDNYDSSSRLTPERVFGGFYLANKLVDGECVSMLCPTTPGVDNYCKALRDCKR